MRKIKTHLLYGLLTLLATSPLLYTTAHALITMDTESVNMALRYGMMNQNKGFAGILGSNWIEGQDGALLNIYTPFMLLATKAARGGYPENPTEEDIKAARKKFDSMIKGFTDAEEKQRVKFAVSFFGNTVMDGVKTYARLEGVTEGRTVILRPSKEFRQPSATVKPSETYNGKFDIVNSYYFNMEDLAKMDSYDLTLTPPTGDPIRFHIRNQQIY